eukprot:scaffold649_cov347-Pavlova_lutheri.AAC.96
MEGDPPSSRLVRRGGDPSGMSPGSHESWLDPRQNQDRKRPGEPTKAKLHPVPNRAIAVLPRGARVRAKKNWSRGKGGENTWAGEVGEEKLALGPAVA